MVHYKSPVLKLDWSIDSDCLMMTIELIEMLRIFLWTNEQQTLIDK